MLLKEAIEILEKNGYRLVEDGTVNHKQAVEFMEKLQRAMSKQGWTFGITSNAGLSKEFVEADTGCSITLKFVNGYIMMSGDLGSGQFPTKVLKDTAFSAAGIAELVTDEYSKQYLG